MIFAKMDGFLLGCFVCSIAGSFYLGRVRVYEDGLFVLMPEEYCCYIAARQRRVPNRGPCGELFYRGLHLEPVGSTVAFFEPLSIKECTSFSRHQAVFVTGSRTEVWLTLSALISGFLLIVRRRFGARTRL